MTQPSTAPETPRDFPHGKPVVADAREVIIEALMKHVFAGSTGSIVASRKAAGVIAQALKRRRVGVHVSMISRTLVVVCARDTHTA